MSDRVAVIGAGPAGSVAAVVLARAGVSVDLIDPSIFPRDKTCGDVLGAGSVKVLNAIGLGHLTDAAYVVTGQRFVDAAEATLGRSSFGSKKRNRPVMMTRRHFDAAMRDAALEAGASPVHARFVEFGPADARGRTVILSHSDGSTSANAYAFVIGADGARSTVAHAAGLHPGLNDAHAVTLRQYLTVSTVVDPELLFFEPAGPSVPDAGPEYHWAFPVASDKLNVGVYACGPTAGRRMASRLRAFQQHLDKFLGDEATLTPDGPVRGGIVRYDFDPTRVTADRVALVGDAAGISDAVLGEGIAHAIRSGRIAAESLVDTGLSRSAETGIVERLDAVFTAGVSARREAAHQGVTVFTN